MFWKLLQLSSAASLKTPSFERYKLCASSKYQYKIVACSIYCRALWRTYVLYCVLRWSSRPWPLFLSHYWIHDAYIWHFQGYHVAQCPTGYQKRTVQILRVLHVYSKALEITRLDLTMQPLIHPILSQIIDSSPCCPERFRDFSCMRFPFRTKQKVLSHVNSFWSDIYKKRQKPSV